MTKLPTNTSRAKRLDRLMAWVISLGGLSIIAAVLGILLFIGVEAFPLFRSPRVVDLGRTPLPVAQGVWLEEDGRGLVTVSAEGLSARAVEGGPEISRPAASGPALPWRSILGPVGKGDLLVLGSDGTLGLGRTSWNKPQGEQDPLRWAPTLEWLALVKAQPEAATLLTARAVEGGGLTGGLELRVAALDAQGRLLWAGGKPEDAAPMAWTPLDLPASEGAPRAAEWTADGQQLVVGTDRGRLLLLEPAQGPEPLAVTTVDEPVTALGFALGHVSLLVGGEKGGLQAVQILRREGRVSLQPFHRFGSHPAAVQGFRASLRDKRFMSWSSASVAVDHLTTERRLFFSPASKVQTAALAARGDFLLAQEASGEVRRWRLDAPHAPISWKVLWGKVHYEGYEKPEYVWQSTGSTDDFEPKLSLMPLLFGTLKGTLFAMVFALPLAVLGALYTSQFASHRLRNTIKPAVEVMAALPSVVLGFVAGLVLAPLFERAAIQVALLPVTAILVAVALLPIWGLLPRPLRARLAEGREALWIIPVILLGLGVAMAVGPWLERTFLMGDFRNWLYQAQGITYDQRNALVVGFAMGFAVIPIIFTISEDALTSVPRALSSASLACGASPWQTAWRVVLPTASPGIFSAIMVGFGRAIGETMIVLMATGNTPVMDWSPFNGMRTLAANIAVETPEAPVHGTLYRLLFFTALLLFALTFLLNTLAEVIRQHLRKRYESF